jgi:hypothetical protein
MHVCVANEHMYHILTLQHVYIKLVSSADIRVPLVVPIFLRL